MHSKLICALLAAALSIHLVLGTATPIEFSKLLDGIAMGKNLNSSKLGEITMERPGYVAAWPTQMEEFFAHIDAPGRCSVVKFCWTKAMHSEQPVKMDKLCKESDTLVFNVDEQIILHKPMGKSQAAEYHFSEAILHFKLNKNAYELQAWEDWDGVHNTGNKMKNKVILLKTAEDTTIVITSSIHCNVILEKISAKMQAKKVNFGNLDQAKATQKMEETNTDKGLMAKTELLIDADKKALYKPLKTGNLFCPSSFQPEGFMQNDMSVWGGRHNGSIEFQYTLEENGNAANRQQQQQQQTDAQNTPDYIGLLELVHDSDISTCQWILVCFSDKTKGCETASPKNIFELYIEKLIMIPTDSMEARSFIVKSYSDLTSMMLTFKQEGTNTILDVSYETVNGLQRVRTEKMIIEDWKAQKGAVITIRKDKNCRVRLISPFDNKMVLYGSYKDKEKLRAAMCEAKAATT